MKNGEKYKSVEERTSAFYRYCHGSACSDISAACKHERCVLEWLEMEASAPEPLPCPFCGKECVVTVNPRTDNCGVVKCRYCGYESGHCATEDGAVEEHNRVSLAAMAALGKEN